jgi:phosphotransferase system  glucose/maltose/N-acetylglucosamine-specific IIC component
MAYNLAKVEGQMNEFFSDDKNMVIVATIILGLAVIFVPQLSPEAANIINSICSGLFGIAVGKSLK